MCSTCDIKNAARYRHRWEMPMVAISFLLSLGVVILSLSAPFLFENLTEESDMAKVVVAGYFILASPLLLYVLRLYVAAKQRAFAAKVGPEQFPEIWAVYTELLEAIDLPHPPALYVANGNGAMNAFALSCTVRRKYVVLHAEIATLMAVDPDIVRFVLAHELAHHKLGHTSLARMIAGLVMQWLFLPGKALIRAQEYSADRLALALCPGTADKLLSLTVGPWLAHRINPEAFAEQSLEEDKSLMVRVINIASDHAVMTKRYKAMLDIERDGFGRHGQMF